MLLATLPTYAGPRITLPFSFPGAPSPMLSPFLQCLRLPGAPSPMLCPSYSASVSLPPLQVRALRLRLLDFMQRRVLPSEAAFEAHAAGPDRWTILPLMERLKEEVWKDGGGRQGMIRNYS